MFLRAIIIIDLIKKHVQEIMSDIGCGNLSHLNMTVTYWYYRNGHHHASIDHFSHIGGPCSFMRKQFLFRVRNSVANSLK